jgi:hypothetical protein
MNLDYIDILMLVLILINILTIAYFITALTAPRYPKPRIQLVAVVAPPQFFRKKPVYETKVLAFKPKKKQDNKKE